MSGGPAIPLAVLQQQGACIVAKGQIIPILPGSPLSHSVLGGEAAIKDVLMRELNIGSPAPGGFPAAPGGSGFNMSQQGAGGNFGGFPNQGGAGNFGGNNFVGNRRQNWDRGGRNNRM